MFKIKDLQEGMDGISVEGWVSQVLERRNVMTKFGQADVLSVIFEDETGKIVLDLWRDQIKIAKIGALLHIDGGFTKNVREQLTLSVGSKGGIAKMDL